jgi:response regulator RpfG family c-di-GMP phosphodiesterase
MESTAKHEAPTILVVDDEAMIREVLADFLSLEGFSVRTAANGVEALTELSRGQCDLVLTDLKMPKMGGLELLDSIQKNMPYVVVVIMTGFGTIETAIGAMKRGAYDYILKPFKVDEVVHTLRRGLEKQKLVAENMRLKETLSLFKVSEAIAASLSLDEVVQTIVDTAVHEVSADIVSVILDDGEGRWFERARIVDPDLPNGDSLGAFDADALAAYFEEDKPLLVHGTMAERFVEKNGDGTEIVSLAVTPLRVKNVPIGFLCVTSITPSKRFDEGQRKLLHLVSNRASAAIENAKLYEDLKATFRQTIRGLASAIDKMDRYTAGHSERVAAYAQVLAIKLGLPEDEVEIVRQAALMHDIGKIGCVLNLNKPGKLTQAEYEDFQLHATYGKEILDPIQFLGPLVPGVHLHHERWDGLGYPLGLKAQEIPVIARIISVADTYDAMTSDRAYRRALPHQVAYNEIHTCSGSQFDPDVSHPFLEAIEEVRGGTREGPAETAGEQRERADAGAARMTASGSVDEH